MSAYRPMLARHLEVVQYYIRFYLLFPAYGPFRIRAVCSSHFCLPRASLWHERRVALERPVRPEHPPGENPEPEPILDSRVRNWSRQSAHWRDPSSPQFLRDCSQREQRWRETAPDPCTMILG